MTDLGAIEDGEVRLLGIRLALKKDYQAIEDLRLEPDRSIKVFFKLLDAHLVRELVAALAILIPESERDRLRIVPAEAGSEALARIGGDSLEGLLDWSRIAHREMLDKLDSVLPPALSEMNGHVVPYVVRALSDAEFRLGDRHLQLRPLLMFDDCQELSANQRDALIGVLADRQLNLHRWLAERYQALSTEEVVADEQPDRGYTLLRIEDQARQLGSERRRGRRTRGFERLLLDIADLRAASALRTDAEEERPFRELLDLSVEADDPRVIRATEELDRRLVELSGSNHRYAQWLAIVGTRYGYEGAVERRAVEILIERDRRRQQDTLFAVQLDEQDLRDRMVSGLREAAGLFLRREFQLPFYYGLERLTRLASENIEQYVTLSGEIFEEMLARITLDEPLAIDPLRQDAIVTLTSEMAWRQIPRRLPGGRPIQRLLLNIASLCRAATYRPTAPYLPGATATAISMRDRDRLLDPEWRAQVPGADALFAALAGAIGQNLISAELNYVVKDDRWMVLKLNRLLCARFGLALGLGGIRERPVEDLCVWMVNEVPDEVDVVEPSIHEQLAF
jgi:hypothetical protein